jgi:hypothetical protein
MRSPYSNFKLLKVNVRYIVICSNFKSSFIINSPPFSDYYYWKKKVKESFQLEEELDEVKLAHPYKVKE